MKTSEQINELAAALATVQGLMEPAKMNAVNPFLKNKYADLGSVIESVKDLLSEHGLSYVQMPATPPVELHPAIALTTRLMHTSGQWLEDTFVMAIPLDEKGKSVMQIAGSAISYARRYALSAMLGIVADEDNDGNGNLDNVRGRNVTKNPPKAKQNGSNPAVAPTQQKPSEAQMKQFHSLGTEVYGSDWDEKRADLVEYVTGGRTNSSKQLTLDEWQKLMSGMEKKLA